MPAPFEGAPTVFTMSMLSSVAYMGIFTALSSQLLSLLYLFFFISKIFLFLFHFLVFLLFCFFILCIYASVNAGQLNERTFLRCSLLSI